MKNIIYGLFVIISLFMIVGCNARKDENSNQFNSNNQQDSNISNSESNNLNEVIKFIKVIINGKEYKLDLEDNETAKGFINILPKELKMNELNGNEKYSYLDISFPTEPTNPKRINAGDVMLYGNNCLVIFYKSFETTYTYTKIGHIDNLTNLGNENIIVYFEK